MSRRPAGYWDDLDKIRVESKKYKYRKEFSANSSGAHMAAIRHGILEEVTAHMVNRRGHMFPGHWDNISNIKAAALLCATKSEFVKKYSGAYEAAKRKGVFDLVTSKMTPATDVGPRHIYVIRKPGEKIIYIGLSNDPVRRFKDHKYKSSNRIKNLIKRGGRLYILTPKIDEYLAAKEELKFVLDYKKRGWAVYNTATAGALGSRTITNTKEVCMREAKKYKSRHEFFKNRRGMYQRAHNHGWLSEMFKDHLNNGYTQKPSGYSGTWQYS